LKKDKYYYKVNSQIISLYLKIWIIALFIYESIGGGLLNWLDLLIFL